MGRFNNRLYTAYSSWYVLGTVASMQVPFVEYLPIRTSEHMAALGVFGLLQLVAFVEIVRKMVPGRQFQMLLRAFVVLVFAVSFTVLVLLTFSGWIAPWTGRFYSLWDTGYAKVHSKLNRPSDKCSRADYQCQSSPRCPNISPPPGLHSSLTSRCSSFSSPPVYSGVSRN